MKPDKIPQVSTKSVFRRNRRVFFKMVHVLIRLKRQKIQIRFFQRPFEVKLIAVSIRVLDPTFRKQCVPQVLVPANDDKYLRVRVLLFFYSEKILSLL